MAIFNVIILIVAVWAADPAQAQHRKARPMAQPDSVLLLNTTNNQIEYQRNADQIRPMASITKIMTAMVSLDWDKDLDRKLRYSRRVAGRLPVQDYSRRDLLKAMLVNSDNAASETLAADYPGGRTEFVAAMNRLAASWNLYSIRFEDPSGLGAGNVGTARDIAEMLQASASYWLIREISVQKQIEIEAKIKQRVRTVNLNNTNTPILFEFDNIVVSKTGTTSRAGYCLGLVVEQNQRQYVAVFLGHPSKIERANNVKNMLYNYLNDANFGELVIPP